MGSIFSISYQHWFFLGTFSKDDINSTVMMSSENVPSNISFMQEFLNYSKVLGWQNNVYKLNINWYERFDLEKK